MRKEYKTIHGEAQAELIEKKSRFIATVKPVATQEEAVAFIDALRSRYWDATHNVYAYVLLEDNIKRYSDDGEPSGTAGVPVLSVIEKEGLFDVAVVVTRYFGGTLLGTGGLVRAYSQSAKAGIEASGIISRVRCNTITITCDYGTWGKVQNLITTKNIPIQEVNYTSCVEAVVYETIEKTERLITEVTDKTDALAVCKIGDCRFITMDKNGNLIK